jgi:hypothetical protein
VVCIIEGAVRQLTAGVAAVGFLGVAGVLCSACEVVQVVEGRAKGFAGTAGERARRVHDVRCIAGARENCIVEAVKVVKLMSKTKL